MHAMIEIHVDEDDSILERLLRVGGFGFTDKMGHSEVTWIPKTKNQTIKQLREILSVLEKSASSLREQNGVQQ